MTNKQTKDEKAHQASQDASNGDSPLADLTMSDFKNIGLPITENKGDEGTEQPHPIMSSVADIKQAFSPLVQNQDKSTSNAYDRCLRSLLVELKWPGEERHIVQAMPHFQDMDSLIQFQGVLSHLGFQSSVTAVSSRSLASRLPCLVVTDEETPFIALRILTNGRLLIYDGPKGDLSEIDMPKGKSLICAVETENKTDSLHRNRKISWFYDGLRKFKSKILVIFALTFVANLLALATPIYTMNVYNRVIGSKSLDTLGYLALAIIATLFFEVYIRRVRGRMVAYIGARFNTQLLTRGFERILNLPIKMTESASVSQQIVRLRQFENVQAFFTGPLVSAGLDLPFTVVFILAISIIHPTLAFIPVCLAIIFAIIALFSMPMTKRNVLFTGKSRQEHQNLLIETVNKRETVRQLRAEDVWIKRWHDIGQQYSARRFNAQFFDTIMHTLAQSLVMIAGIATLWVGALLVMKEELSVGALIAVMMFVWRILSPIQTAFLSLNRIGQFSETAKQADLLMSLAPERQVGGTPTLRRHYDGRITFNNVSFRYGSTGDPVFRGLTADIPAKQVVAITGDTASGKGTFLKLIMGLYQPLGGTMYLDGLNLKQLDVDEVRTSIGYVGPKPDFFYGTVAQNIRLAHPDATDSDVEEAMSRVGICLPHPQLEEGINTRLTSERLSSMPMALKQSLSLARAFVKNVPIYLLDSPMTLLNPFEKQALFDQLEAIRGNATVVISTNDDSLIDKCDRVLYLRNGVVAFDDTPEAFFRAKAKSKAS
ncbi:MAG: ABC transporter transmembrane domain-containing protein [Hyphomicrobiales bacterium]